MTMRVLGPLFALVSIGAALACSGAETPAERPSSADEAGTPPATSSDAGTPVADASPPLDAADGASPTLPSVDCKALAIEGDPRASAGAKWTYDATHGGITYKLDGVLFTPSASGPHPAVVVSHGKGGQPTGYSTFIAKQMVTWGLVAIATRYSHASSDDGQPKGGEGASPENVLRAYAARELLACLGYVDQTRVAAHGHSMGGFLTGELVGSHPASFRVASHTAGGTNGVFGTKPATAALIKAPYQMHHGDIDTVVPIADDRALAQVLTGSGTVHQLIEYPGFDHNDMPLDATMLSSVRAWYTTHGMF